MIITQALTAGTWFEFYEPGDFFRILTDSVSTSFDVEYYKAGTKVVDAVSVKAGYSERFVGSEFDRVKIRATVDSTVQFVIRLGNTVGYDIAPTGSVTVNGISNAVTMTQITRTVTTGNTLLASAKANRKYLLIQNRDTVGSVWVNLIGGAATVAGGVYLGPGDSLEMSTVLTVHTIQGIGDIASNANVIVVEG